MHSQGVAHRKRESVSARTPAHVNFRLRASIRNKFCLRLLKRAILNARLKGLEVVHYSLQSNHVHLIVEAMDSATLTRGMRSLTVTFAKGLKRGRVQLGRYNLHVLRTVEEAKTALRYVLLNEQKHTRTRVVRVDGYASWSALPLEWTKSFLRKERLGWIPAPAPWAGVDKGNSWLLRKGAELLATG